jgi:FecR-like protein
MDPDRDAGGLRSVSAGRPTSDLPAIIGRGVLAGLLASVLLFAAAVAHAQSVSVGVAKNAIGELKIIRSDGRSEILRGPGALPLYPGDKLHTGPGAKALIEFHDGTRCALNGGTEFAIQQRWQREAGITRVLRMVIGEIWVKTGIQPVALEVETPVASASVKGTEFVMKVAPGGRSELTVVEGLVEFGTAFGTCPIRGGTMSVGESGKKCTKPVPAEVAPVLGWVEEIAR